MTTITDYFRMTGAELRADGSKAALAEITRRAEKRAARTEAPAKPSAKKAEPKAPAPKGPGSRGGNPRNVARRLLADQVAPTNSPEWWAEYRRLGKVITPAQANKALKAGGAVVRIGANGETIQVG